MELGRDEELSSEFILFTSVIYQQIVGQKKD